MNPPNGQTPVDYLNQIAPQAPKKPLFQLSIGKVLIVGGTLIVIVILIALFANAGGPSNKEQWQQLSARLAATSAIASDASSNIKSSDLRSLNSELKLYLTNTTRDLQEHLTAHGVVVAKIPLSITTKESAEAIITELEDGRLNNKYDTTYAREMGYQLARLLSLLEKMETSASDSEKEFLNTAHQNLTPIYNGIESFSTTNE